MQQNYRIHSKETTVRVLNTKISAVRKKDIIKKAVRIIEDDKIGIAGAIGDVPNEQLKKEAKANLSINIPYPYKKETPRNEKVIFDKNTITSENVLENLESILKFLISEYPEFDFSEVASVIESDISFSDDEGTLLSYKDSVFSLGLLMKEKALANLFDGFIGYQGRKFDKDIFIEKTREILDAYKVEAEMPEENILPIMFMTEPVFNMKLLTELNGEKYGNGSSLFTGKMNKKIFDEKVNVIQDFNPLTAYRPFFDHEGVVNEDYKYTLIENGVLKACYTNKKVAYDYDLKQTGSASGAYDDVPTLDMTNLSLNIDTENLAETVTKGIMVVIAAGGDYTPDGAFASPVQKAFLYENGKIIGKLPEFQIKSHIYDMLGKDYIGTFKSPYYIEDHHQISVVKMTIVK